jgi:hypothetical protein
LAGAEHAVSLSEIACCILAIKSFGQN